MDPVQDAGNINTDFCDASPMDAGTLWRVIFGPILHFQGVARLVKGNALRLNWITERRKTTTGVA